MLTQRSSKSRRDCVAQLVGVPACGSEGLWFKPQHSGWASRNIQNIKVQTSFSLWVILDKIAGKLSKLRVQQGPTVGAWWKQHMS